MAKRWPLNKAYIWERAPFSRILLPLVAGISLYPPVSVFVQPNIVLILALLGAGSLLYGIVVFTKQSSYAKTITGFLVLNAVIVLAAWVLCYCHDVRNNKHWFGRHADKTDGYVARVCNAPVEKEKAWKLEVEVTHAVSGSKAESVTGRALVYMYKHGAPVVREGDLIILPDRWQPIKNSGNPYEFDYAGYMAGRNVYLRQFVAGKNVHVYSYGDEQLGLIRRVHHWCVGQLEWYITDKETLGLMKAMLMNDTDMLDDDLSDAYEATGIVHIIAISGGHIAVFFFVVAMLLAWLRHRKYSWIKYIAAIPLIWLYVVVAGAPPSAVRAATMFSLLGIGFALQKSQNGINQLLGTAFILLCANPAWLFDIGFQLSFIAVLSIMIFYKPIYKWAAPANKITRVLWSAVAVSIAAEILVAPIVIYYFHLFPLQFIIANVLAWLFMGIVLVLGMLLIAVSPFYTVAKFIAGVIEQLVTWFNKLVYELQQLNFESFSRLTLTDMQLVLLYASIILISVFLLHKYKRALFAGMITTCAFLFCCCMNRWQALHHNMLILYNSNKGNHTELITGNKAVQINAPDSIDANIRKFILQPAHINLQIDSIEKVNANFIRINGKTIFIIDKAIPDAQLHADYVVLDYAAKKQDVSLIQQVFRNKVLIIGNAVSKNRAAAIAKEATLLGIKTHTIRNEGAFVLHPGTD
jgi:competence protein ComEC